MTGHGRKPDADVVAPGAEVLVLDERYRLGSRLGAGGMAEVRGAFDTRLHRHVAVKLLRDSPAADPERFGAEIRTLARLEHPNIVRLLDAGTAPDGRSYLVMELVDGTTLASRCGSGPLEAPEVAAIGAGVAAGLAYVHERNVVHRDVKPANILLGPDERVRLADFGIARLVGAGAMTRTGLVLGTPAYLAPEQLTGRSAGPPADVYAFGLVLAECLIGRRRYEGSAAEAVAARIGAVPPALDDVAQAWRPLLEAMTSPDPLDRPTAREVGAVLATMGDATDPAGQATAPVVLGVRDGLTLASASHA